MDEDLEFTLLHKKDVMVFHPIPPASSAKGHKAEDWTTCIWRGRCRVCGKGTNLLVKLLQLKEGAEELFAECIVHNGDYAKWVERTVDSSRFFVLKITNGARHEFIGMGFEDRNDAFDFNCTLSDFKSTWVDRSQEQELVESTGPAKDLSLKEGQKITINFKGLGSKKREERPADANGGGFGAGGFGILAPPPPGGQSRRQPAVAAAPAFAAPAATAAPAPSAMAEDDFFGDFTGFQGAAATPATAPAPAPVPAPAPAAAASAPFSAVPAPAPAALDQQMQGLASGLEGLSFGAPAASPTPPSQPPTGAAPLASMGAPLDFAPATAMPAAPAVPAFQQPPARPPAAAQGGFDPFAGFGGLGNGPGASVSGLGAPAAIPAQPGVFVNVGAPASSAFSGFGAPTASGFGQPPMQKSGDNQDPFDDFDIFK